MPLLPIEPTCETIVEPGDNPDSVTVRTRWAPAAPIKVSDPVVDANGCKNLNSCGTDLCICAEETTDNGAVIPVSVEPPIGQGGNPCNHGLHRYQNPDGSWCIWAEAAPRPVCICVSNEEGASISDQPTVLEEFSDLRVAVESGCYPMLLNLTTTIKGLVRLKAGIDITGVMSFFNAFSGNVTDVTNPDGTQLDFAPYERCDESIQSPHQHLATGPVQDIDPDFQGGVIHFNNTIAGPKILLDRFSRFEWRQRAQIAAELIDTVGWRFEVQPGEIKICLEGTEVTSPLGVITSEDGAAI